MKFGTVTRAQIDAHPTKSLLPKDYLDPDHMLRRDVTVRVSGEAAAYVRRMSVCNGVSMRDVVNDMLLQFIHLERRPELIEGVETICEEVCDAS